MEQGLGRSVPVPVVGLGRGGRPIKHPYHRYPHPHHNIKTIHNDIDIDIDIIHIHNTNDVDAHHNFPIRTSSPIHVYHFGVGLHPWTSNLVPWRRRRGRINHGIYAPVGRRCRHQDKHHRNTNPNHSTIRIMITITIITTTSNTTILP